MSAVNEVVVFSWYDASREQTTTDKTHDAINSIRYYYTHVVAGVTTTSVITKSRFMRMGPVARVP